MTAPDVVTIVAQEPYLVRVVFADGEVRDVDIAPLLDVEVFALLRERTESNACAWTSRQAPSPGRAADLDPDVVYATATATGRPAARITTPQPA